MLKLTLRHIHHLPIVSDLWIITHFDRYTQHIQSSNATEQWYVSILCLYIRMVYDEIISFR